MSSNLTPTIPPTVDELFKNLVIDKHDDHSILDPTSQFWHWRDQEALKKADNKNADVNNVSARSYIKNENVDINKAMQLQQLYYHQERDMQARIMSDLQVLDAPDKIEQKKIYTEKLWENMRQVALRERYNKIINSLVLELDKQIKIYGKNIKDLNPTDPKDANEKKYMALQACRAELEKTVLEKNDKHDDITSKYKKFFKALIKLDGEVKSLPSNNPLKRLINWVLEKTGHTKSFDTGAQKVSKKINRAEKEEIYPTLLTLQEEERGKRERPTSDDDSSSKRFKKH